MRVQIALGDLTDPPSFRNAMRGVHTVVHLAASIRDQPRGSIEELNGIATWRMVEAAQRQGVERFVYFSALGASIHHRTRLLRAKALAEQAVREADMQTIIFAPSIIYAPGDHWMTLLERMSLLPADARIGPRPRPLPADLGAGRRGLRARRAARCRTERAPSATSWRAPRRSATTTSSARCSHPTRAAVPSCTCRPRSSRAPCGCWRRRRAGRVRHLGRGRADGGHDDLPARRRGRRGAGRQPPAPGSRARHRLIRAPVR